LRRAPWLLLLCLAIFWPVAAGAAPESGLSTGEVAATGLSIQQLRIQVMPEFDDPRVLVIAQGRLSAPDTEFPLAVTFRVPQGAQINQMAVMNMMTGGTRPQPFEVQPDEDDSRWSLVTYTLDDAHFFYEYYYNPLGRGTEKLFTFALNSLQPITDLLLEIQQPLAAQQFALGSAPASTRFDEVMGFTYHQFPVGTLAAGEDTEVAVSYIKTDPAPSLSRDQVVMLGMQGSESTTELISAEMVDGQARSAVPIWIFASLGAVTCAGVALVVWYRARQDSATLAPALEASRGSFCFSCGTSLKAGAQFCHHCGMPSRVAVA
jgi:hypothetical protein